MHAVKHNMFSARCTDALPVSSCITGCPDN